MYHSDIHKSYKACAFVLFHCIKGHNKVDTQITCIYIHVHNDAAEIWCCCDFHAMKLI